MIHKINDHLVNFDNLHKIFVSRVDSITIENDWFKSKKVDRVDCQPFNEINPYNQEAKNFILDFDNQILGFIFNFPPKDAVKISRIMNDKYLTITGMRVLKSWPPHLDVSREGIVMNIVLNSEKSSTVFHNSSFEETARIVGKNFYYFDPSKIIHSVEIVDNDYMDILGFVKIAANK